MLLCDLICPLKILCNIKSSVSRRTSTLFPLYTSDNFSFASEEWETRRRKLKPSNSWAAEIQLIKLFFRQWLYVHRSFKHCGVWQLPSAPSSSDEFKMFRSIVFSERDGRVERLRAHVVRISTRTNIKVESVSGRYLRNNKLSSEHCH